MALFDFLEDLFRSEAQHLVFERIPPERQDPALDEVIVVAEKHYVRVWLAEMFLAEDRRLFNGYVPVVHSAVRLQFGDKPALELPYIAGPQNIGMGQTLSQGVQLDHPLTNLLPFRGGTFTLAAGLFAYKSKDFFSGFSKVLHDVTAMLNVGQLSTALKVVDGAVAGIQNLIGGGDKDIHLLYFQGFGGSAATGGSPLKSGYTAIVNTDDDDFDKSKLYVKQSRLCHGENLATAEPLTGYDYMLLRIEANEFRDDFLSFESLADLLRRAIKEGRKDRAAGDAVITTAIEVAWDSADLTVADRVRVAKGLRDAYEEALGPAGPGPSDLSGLAKVLNRRTTAIAPSRLAGVVDQILATDMKASGFAELMREKLK